MKTITILALVATHGVTSATIVTFDSLAGFSASESAVTSGLTASTTTEDFSSATPGSLAFATAHSFSGFDAEATNLPGENMTFFLAPDPYFGADFAPFTRSQFLGWAEDNTFLNGNGNFGPSIELTFGPDVRAVSFDFLDTDLTDEYNIFVNGVSVNTGFGADFLSGVDDSYEGVQFFGITSSVDDITSIVFSTPTTVPGGVVEDFGIDNVRVTSAVETMSPIPEPSSGLVIGLLLAPSFFLRRKR